MEEINSDGAPTESTPLVVLDDGSGASHGASQNHLGLIQGVIVPCLLNIVGSILFLRMSWATGQAGVGGVLLMLLVGSTQTTLTVLSLSALISNGEMKGGGPYYIISRAVGPELGGAIGLVFWLSYSASACFYFVSTAEVVVLALFPNHPGWSDYEIHLLVASVCLWVGALVSFIGAGCFSRVNVPLFIIQFFAIGWSLLSMYFTPDPCLPPAPPFDNATGLPCGAFQCNNGTDLVYCGSYSGWSTHNLNDNGWFGFSTTNCNGLHCSWFIVFAVVFPALTGIFEGANLSGDLRHPNRDIWRGTLFAIVSSFVLYAWAVFTFGGAVDRFTLQHNLFLFQQMSFGTVYIVIVGTFIACWSSGLGAVMGSSRILQAVSRDDIFPFIGAFGRGYGKGDEPRLAVLLTVAVAQLLIFAGDLNSIAPIITTFFCLSYFLVNAALFLVSIAGTPNFRPRFKYWHWSSALVGALLNFVVMWLLSWVYSLIACGIFVALVIVLSIFNAYRSNEGAQLDFGDVRWALLFHQVRKYLLRLNSHDDHGKLWRPSLLYLGHDLNSSLLVAGNYLKRGGVYIVGDVLVSDRIDQGVHEQLERLNERWLERTGAADIKAFSQVLLAPTARFGCHALIAASGLGALSPNTVLLPLYGHEQTAFASIDEYVSVMRDAAALDKNIIIGCNFDAEHAVPKNLFQPPRLAPMTHMDLFILPHEGMIETWDDFSQGPLGALTLGWALARSNFSMRVIRFVEGKVDLEQRREMLVDIIKRQGRFRIGKKGSQILVKGTEGQESAPFDTTEYARQANALVARHRLPETSLVFLPLPNMNLEPKAWLDHATELVRGLGPTLLYYTCPKQQMMSRQL